MTFRGDHDFDPERCLRPSRPPSHRPSDRRGKGGIRGDAGGKGGRAEAQQRQPTQTPSQQPSTWWQPTPSAPMLQPPPAWQPPPMWRATGPQPPPTSELPPQATPQAPQWGQSRPPQRSGGRGDDLGAYAGAGFEGYGPPPNPELASRILLCCNLQVRARVTVPAPAALPWLRGVALDLPPYQLVGAPRART